MPMVFVSSPDAGEPSDNTCTHIMNTVSDHDDHPTTTLRFGSGAIKHHARHRERMETETATLRIRTRNTSRKRGSHRSDTAVSMPWLMNPSRLASLIMTAGLIAVPLGLSASYMSAKSAFAEQAGSQSVLAAGAQPLPAVAATYTPGVNNNLVANNTAVSNVRQDSVTVADTHDTNAMSQASSSIPSRTKNPGKANVDTVIKLDSGTLLHPGDPSRLSAISAAASRSSARESLDTTGILPALQTEVTGEFKLSTDEIDVDRMIGPSKDATDENNNENSNDTANDGNNDEGTNDTTSTANDGNHFGVSDVDTANTADTSDIDVKGHPTPVNTGDFGNAYPWGQCTWWAYVRRHQLGLAAASHFGNGGQWAYTARALGYTVTSKPGVGDVVVFAPGQEGADGYYGHVAIVEHVNADGSILISESNVRGLGVISNRVIPAGSVPFLQYIK